jgi:hypothetical protein
MTEKKYELREFTLIAGPPDAVIGTKEVLLVPVVK